MTNLIVHDTAPYNAEPPLDRLGAAFITPADDFYIRCHGPIPELDAATHRITVQGMVAQTLSLSVAELQQRFAHRTITATLQCAGNRRADLQPVRATTGNPWGPGAIGTARWTGISLGDLLQAVGADTSPTLHVAFDAADTIDLPEEGRFTYGVSIPIAKAGHALLAWAMNDEPLAPEHGFPLRVIVPGYAGVRSPKWLTTITVQPTPSANHMQQRDYKMLPPGVTGQHPDWTKGATINDMPLTAAICEPAHGATLPAGPATLRGYAMATGRDIARVELSRDNGITWVPADLEENAGTPWSWTLWRATMDLPAGDHTLVVRAWDSAGQTQPSRAEDVWNVKGYLCAAWHRIQVSTVQPA